MAANSGRLSKCDWDAYGWLGCVGWDAAQVRIGRTAARRIDVVIRIRAHAENSVRARNYHVNALGRGRYWPPAQ